ncbi:branched-chain amino acid ABC transporter permease [Corynebacterium sp. sy017]|uniref:AzlC family ABC transporter permease n=1 Tax=unclassified Corynebacterium TaxID=2624378 RepID=UPI0011867845|nr:MULTISPECIES: AzlC family ABC transporter permease [unclassified Corynebacterium]MBP3088251.1 branched-chain amino acid ABC transporter permease [Corynebacterium sp. sy017]TSD91579.1 branched-chain amino acid ABC transporter permease [Corynebacterium sp. SY003]
MVSHETRKEILAAIKLSWAVGLGLIPLGLAFGLFLTQSGFDWWWTPIFSIVIYAGSMEFLAVGLVTQGVGPLSAALTGFMVNFRHIFYGLTFPRHRIKNKYAKGYVTYALTDESYAIVSAHDLAATRRAEKQLSGRQILTIVIWCQLLWVVSGIFGALCGAFLPADIKGMDFALTALFAVLAWEAFAAHKDLSLIIIASCLALAVIVLAPDKILVLALTLYFLSLVLRHLSPRLDKALEIQLGSSDKDTKHD